MADINEQTVAWPPLFRLLDLKDDQASERKGFRDLSAIETSDTLDEWSGHFEFSDQADADATLCESLSVVSDDDYANTNLESEDAPKSRGLVVPQNVAVVSDSLRSALSDAEQAAQFFLENVDDPNFVESPCMEELVGEVRALKQKFLEQILPKVSRAFGKCSTSDEEHHCPQTHDVACVEALRSRGPRLPKESGLLTTAQNVVQESWVDVCVDPAMPSSSLHLALKELAERTSQKDHPRTLAIFGVDALGIDFLGALRKHFETRGKVEFLSQPSISAHIDCALVRMEKATEALCISSAGTHHTLKNVQLVVHRLADVNSGMPSSHLSHASDQDALPSSFRLQ